MVRYLQPVSLAAEEVVELHPGDKVVSQVYDDGKWRVLLNRRIVPLERR